jgi:predicted component of type VI protein secretion system
MVLARLQRLEDRNLKEVFLVTPRTRLTIGHNRSNLLVLNHSSILPFHAIVYWLEDRFVVEPKDPTAEIWINQQPLGLETPQSLANGDQIRLGKIELIFTLDTIASESAEPSTTLKPFQNVLHNRLSVPLLRQSAPTAPIHQLRLDACDLVYRVGSLKLLDDISLSILPTEFVTIVG